MTASKGTAAQPDWYDWYDWHSYSTFGVIYSTSQTVIGIVGDSDLLYVGETGGFGAVTAQSLHNQAELLQGTRWACQELGLPEPAPWILYDLNASTQFPFG